MTERLTFNASRGTVDAASLKSRRSVPVAASNPSAESARAEKPGAENKDWAFLFLLAFTANVFFRPQDAIPALRVLHLAELCALGGLIALTMGRLSRGLPVTRVTPELVGICALGGLIVLLAPFSIWFGGAIAIFKNLYIKVLLIFLLMINVLTSTRRIERLTWLLILASGYIGFRAVFDYVRGVNLIEYGRVQGSIGGIFQNPNDLALNMVSVLPLALFRVMGPERIGRRAVAAMCALFMLGAVVASHSRSGTVGCAAMIAVLACMAIRKRPGLVFGGALAAMLSLPLLPSSYWERLSSIADPSLDETGSREAREILMRESAQAFFENPLTGVGAGQFKNWNPTGREQPWRESHDVFLQVAAELGLGGLVLFTFLIARAGISVLQTRRLLRRAQAAAATRTGARGPTLPAPDIDGAELARIDAHSAAMMAAITGWLVCALFASVAYNWTFYYLLALAATPRQVLMDRMPVRRTRARGLAQPRLEIARV